MRATRGWMAAGRVAVGLVFLAGGCDGAETPGDPAGNCAIGEWKEGDEGAPLMNPGQDCILCHADNEGPDYTAAGTVMEDYDVADNCFGVSGITVRITDADGAVLELLTNNAGNFFTREAIATPYNAEVELDGVVSAMATAQEDTDCMSCHLSVGLNGAPGRIKVP